MPKRVENAQSAILAIDSSLLWCDSAGTRTHSMEDDAADLDPRAVTALLQAVSTGSPPTDRLASQQPCVSQNQGGPFLMKKKIAASLVVAGLTLGPVISVIASHAPVLLADGKGTGKCKGKGGSGGEKCNG